jgi:cell division protein ZipA
MDMQLSVIFGLIIGLSIAIFIIELLRRKKLHFRKQSSHRSYRERSYAISPALETSDEEPDIRNISSGNEPLVQQAETVAVKATARRLLSEQEDIIVISIMAEPGKKFIGYDLLQALLSAGLRFGKMSIFHRHEEANGKGKVLFSLASATKPGTFDIHKMGGVSCIGLTLFMRLSEHDEPLKVYDLMIKTASLLAEDLQGGLFEADRLPLNHAAIEEMRQWIHAYQSQPESAVIDG